MTHIQRNSMERELPRNIDRQLLLCMPEQSGKTREMINKIMDTLIPSFEGSSSELNLIFCSNSILTTNQTHHRVQNTLEFSNIVNDRKVLHLSSSKKANISDIYEAYFHITNKNNKVCAITMCANIVRWNHTVELINRLSTDIEEGRVNINRINIWIDESDKYDHIVQKVMEKQNECPNLYLYKMTATPFSKIPDSYVNVIPLHEPRPENYCGWDPTYLDFDVFDTTKAPEEFVEFILDSNCCRVPSLSKLFLQPNTKWFIPCEVTLKKHESMKNLLCSYGFVTIVINGEGISVYMPNGRVIERYAKDEEILDILRKIFIEFNLDTEAVAITGNICVSRGLTMIAEDFQYDYSILSYAPNKCEVSQMAGRMKKKGKCWNNLKKTKVFTTLIFNNIARDMETISSNLAKIAKEKEDQGESCILSPEEISTIIPRGISKERTSSRKDNNRLYSCCGLPIYVISFERIINNSDITSAHLLTRGKRTTEITDFIIDHLSLPQEYKQYSHRKWTIGDKPGIDKYQINKLTAGSNSIFSSIGPVKKNVTVDQTICFVVTHENRNEVIFFPWKGSAANINVSVPE